MKASKPSFRIILFAAVFFFASCTKDQDFSSTTREIISEGQWSVDYYYAGQDKTTLFSHFQFVFQGNGVVKGSNGSVSIEGSWNMIRDVNRNDVIRITINSPEPHFSDLTESWNVTEKNSSVVAMKDAQNHELRFRKL